MATSNTHREKSVSDIDYNRITFWDPLIVSHNQIEDGEIVTYDRQLCCRICMAKNRFTAAESQIAFDTDAEWMAHMREHS